MSGREVDVGGEGADIQIYMFRAIWERVHNLEIVLRMCAILRLRKPHVRNLKICMRLYARQRVIYCVARRMEDIHDKRRLLP